MESFVCKFNKFGFCKFEKTCRSRHNNLICENKDCNILECEKRHPKPCKFFLIYKRCKFGSFCKYSHSSEEKEDCNSTLASRLETLEKSILKQNDEIDIMRAKINNLENELITNRSDGWSVKSNENSKEKEKAIEDDVETFVEGDVKEYPFENFTLRSDNLDEGTQNIPQLDGNAMIGIHSKPDHLKFLDSQGNLMVWYDCGHCDFNSTCEAQLKKHKNKRHKSKKSYKKRWYTRTMRH